MSRIILGFSAKKQGGKTTAVGDLTRKLEALGKTVAPVSFADALKRVVNYYFIAPTIGKTIESFDDDAVKNTIHPCGKTYRQLLQIVGTDFFRAIWPDVWVENWKYEVKTMYPYYDYILVPDVRFPNEVKAIQDLGGKVIRFTRAPFADQDQHESETALDEIMVQSLKLKSSSPILFDHVLDNRTMSIPEQNQAIWQLVTGWYPELGGK